jgi:hypothetical protein
MKKMAMAVCIIGICFIGGQAIAGNGYRKNQTAGTGMYVDICAADEIVIVGTISEADLYSGQGIKIDIGNDEVMTVYGIGPIRYWDGLEVARPAIGDGVTIEAREVIFSDGSIKNIATSITFESGETIELRDENCLPNWRGGNGARQSLNTSSLNNINAIHLAGRGNGSGRGPGDGTGNGGNGPKDGTGNGSRTGDCPYTT